MVGRHWSDSAGKESACNAGHPGSILGLGRSPGEGIGCLLQYSWSSLVTQTVNNPPAMWETWVQSLGWEASLEEGMATHSSILAWRIPVTQELGGLQSMESQRVGHDWATKQENKKGLGPRTFTTLADRVRLDSLPPRAVFVKNRMLWYISK